MAETHLTCRGALLSKDNLLAVQVRRAKQELNPCEFDSHTSLYIREVTL